MTYVNNSILAGSDEPIYIEKRGQGERRKHARRATGINEILKLRMQDGITRLLLEYECSRESAEKLPVLAKLFDLYFPTACLGDLDIKMVDRILDHYDDKVTLRTFNRVRRAFKWLAVQVGKGDELAFVLTRKFKGKADDRPDDLRKGKKSITTKSVRLEALEQTSGIGVKVIATFFKLKAER